MLASTLLMARIVSTACTRSMSDRQHERRVQRREHLHITGDVERVEDLDVGDDKLGLEVVQFPQQLAQQVICGDLDEQ